MKLTKEDLIQRLKDSIPELQHVLDRAYAGECLYSKKYLCVMLARNGDNVLTKDDFITEVENEVNLRMEGHDVFSIYLSNTDARFYNLKHSLGHMDEKVLIYEMQKKIQWVKDWIKELEDGTTDLKRGGVSSNELQ